MRGMAVVVEATANGWTEIAAGWWTHDDVGGVVQWYSKGWYFYPAWAPMKNGRAGPYRTMLEAMERGPWARLRLPYKERGALRRAEEGASADLTVADGLSAVEVATAMPGEAADNPELPVSTVRATRALSGAPAATTEEAPDATEGDV